MEFCTIRREHNQTLRPCSPLINSFHAAPAHNQYFVCSGHQQGLKAQFRCVPPGKRLKHYLDSVSRWTGQVSIWALVPVSSRLSWSVWPSAWVWTGDAAACYTQPYYMKGQLVWRATLAAAPSAYFHLASHRYILISWLSCSKCKFDPPDVAVPFGLLFCSDGQTSLSCRTLFTSTEVHLALVCKPLLHWFVLPNLTLPVLWLFMHWHPNEHQLDVCSFVWGHNKTNVTE